MDKFDELLANTLRRCNVCFKQIEKTDPYIVAYKNGYPAFFCREHIEYAEDYLDHFMEFIEPEQPDITKHNPEAVCKYIEGNYNGYDRCKLCGCEFTANHSNFCPGCGVKFFRHERK